MRTRISAASVAAALVGLVVAFGQAHADAPVPVASGETYAAPAAAVGHGHGDNPRAPQGGAAPTAVEPLARDCTGSQFGLHNGFQEAPRCAATAFGEVPVEQQGASLLIVDFPKKVKPGQGFQLKVSTRNLVRDRFLAAGQGGYYLESSLLNEAGLVRGHFHTACQMLGKGDAALAPDRQFGTFVATEDGGGSAAPDTVTVNIAAGLPEKGEARCVAWAGDGSHRVPMMQFANQIIAVDSVRIEVR